jgi:hypothetical protein
MCVETVRFFDLEQIKWQTKWVVNQNYAIPTIISDVIGGGYVQKGVVYLQSLHLAKTHKTYSSVQ